MKRPVLVLQGGPGLGKEYLQNELRFLEQQHAPVILEYAGCGHSSDQPSPSLSYTVQKISDELRKTLTGSQDFDVIAHSWGAYLLLELFRLDPSFTSGKLLFVAPCPVTWKGLQQAGENLQRLLVNRLSEGERNRLAELTPDGNGLRDKEYIRLLKPCYVENRRLAARLRFENYNRRIDDRLSKEMEGYDQTELLKTIPNEIHLILGETDFINEQQLSEYLDRAKTKAVLKNVGHSPFIEDPQAFVSAVSRALNYS